MKGRGKRGGVGQVLRLQYAENGADLLLPVGVQKLKGFQLQGVLAHLPS